MHKYCNRDMNKVLRGHSIRGREGSLNFRDIMIHGECNVLSLKRVIFCLPDKHSSWTVRLARLFHVWWLIFQ